MSPSPYAPVIADPNEGLTWENLSSRLQEKFSKPENSHLLREGQTAEQKASGDAASVLRAFEGFPKPKVLREGEIILRATSFRDPWHIDKMLEYGKRNNPFGSWWFPQSLFLEIQNQCGGDLSNPHCADCVRRKLQSVLAVSDNFSDIEQLWSLRVPAAAKLTVLAGPAFRQPRDSSLAGSYLNMGNLSGGAPQYYILNLPEYSPQQCPEKLLTGSWFGKDFPGMHGPLR
jgi:hypothetical protein